MNKALLQQSIISLGSLTALAAGAVIGSIFIYGLNRGLPMHDEANYILSYEMAKKEYFPHISLTPFLVKYFVPEFVSFVYIKFLHAILKIISFSVMFLGVRAVVRKKTHGKLQVPSLHLAVAFATACVYSLTFGVSTLGYNHVTEALLLCGEGLFLLSVVHRSYLSGFFSGFFSFFIFYAKFSSGAAFVFFLILLVFIFLPTERRRLLTAFFPGLAAATALSLAFMVGPDEWTIYFRTRLEDATGYHTPAGTIKRLFQESLQVFIDHKKYFGAIFVAFLAIAFCIRKFRQDRYRQILKVGFLCMLAFLLFRKHVHYDAQNFYRNLLAEHALITIFPLLLIFFGSFHRFSAIRRHGIDITLILLLLLNPAIGTAGSYNGIAQFSVFLGSWIILPAVCLIFYHHRFRAISFQRLPQLICYVLICVYSTTYLKKFNLDTTYDLNFPIDAQKIPLDFLPKLKFQFVDEDMYNTLKTIDGEIARYRPGYIVQLFDLPGIVYAFNDARTRYLIPEPWPSAFYAEPTKLRNLLVSVTPEMVRQSIFVVNNSYSSAPAVVIAEFNKIGFPGEFKEVRNFNSKNIGFMKIYLHRTATMPGRTGGFEEK